MTQTETAVWRVESFPSGTCIVTTRERGPHLYVYGPKPVGPKDEEGDDPVADRARYQMCEQLAAWLNGGDRPVWMDDMQRVSEIELQGTDGSSITATGPSYDANPPALDWRQCDDQESRDARARLIDRMK